jgi:hypothetical protein
MKLKLKLGTVLICLTFLTGCSLGLLSELVAPVTNFGLGLYNADTYYSKECAWYEEIKLAPDTKQWLADSKPPAGVIKDLSKVARNNDIFKEVCDPREDKETTDE